MSKITRIAKNEIKIVLRERLVLSLGLLISVLLGIALYAGYVAYDQQERVITRKQKEKRTEWLNQGDKHPHMAAHYGTFAFKPKTAFSLFDFGLDTFTGTSVYLEAHFQHGFMFRPAQDHSSMIRFGELSAALVLQILVPLLIIFLAFASFTKERERGTLRLLMSQGISFRELALGKVLAYLGIAFALLVPFLLGVGLLSIVKIDSTALPDARTRLLLMVLLYGLYLFLFVAFSVWVSLRSSKGKNALLTLLTFWIFCTMLMPKTVANLGESVFTLPSMRVFKTQIRNDIDNGLDGNTPRSVRHAQLEKEYLQKYKVDSVQQLPFNFEGVSMQAGEEYGNTVFDHHLEKLRSIFHKQNRLGSFAGLANPYLAVQHLSMGLAGTDIHASIHFENKVEAYRRNLVEKMNGDMAENSAYGEFYEYSTGKELWQQIDDFAYTAPTAFEILRHYTLELISLFLWSILMVLLLFYADKKLKSQL